MLTIVAEPVDPARCPLCGQSNQCGAQAGQDSCWCFDLTIPASVLAAVPPEARGAACVCRACASKARSAEGARPLPLTRG
jgi:hypothetical protein